MCSDGALMSPWFLFIQRSDGLFRHANSGSQGTSLISPPGHARKHNSADASRDGRLACAVQQARARRFAFLSEPWYSDPRDQLVPRNCHPSRAGNARRRDRACGGVSLPAGGTPSRTERRSVFGQFSTKRRHETSCARLTADGSATPFASSMPRPCTSAPSSRRSRKMTCSPRCRSGFPQAAESSLPSVTLCDGCAKGSSSPLADLLFFLPLVDVKMLITASRYDCRTRGRDERGGGASSGLTLLFPTL